MKAVYIGQKDRDVGSEINRDGEAGTATFTRSRR